MKNLSYYNGKIAELGDATVPMSDRVCFFGDGVYDATYARNKKIFTLEEHIDRLYRSANAVGIVPPMEFKELCDLAVWLTEKCEERETFVYVQFTRGCCLPRNHVHEGGKSNLWITVTPKKITPPEKRLSLITCEDTRYGLCSVKTLNLMPNVIAAEKAFNAGCDGAVFAENGMVNECAHSNIHILSNGSLITPDADDKVLGGIARNHLIKACEALNIPVLRRHFSVEEMFDADEVFVTSAGTLLSPCNRIDGVTVGGRDGERTDALQKYLYGEFYAATE